jgi:hypothetical protein
MATVSHAQRSAQTQGSKENQTGLARQGIKINQWETAEKRGSSWAIAHIPHPLGNGSDTRHHTAAKF